METLDPKTIAKLQELIETRDFAHLTPAEKQWVLDHFGEASYEELTSMIHSARSVFTGESTRINPDSHIRNQLLNRFEQVHTRKLPENGGFIKKFLNYQIRLSVALPAAIGLILIALTFVLKLSQDRKVEVKTVTLTDTVYIERNQDNTPTLSNNQIDTVRKMNSREVKLHPPVGHTLPDELQGQIRNLSLLTEMSRQSRRGSNARDDSTLLKLLVTVN